MKQFNLNEYLHLKEEGKEPRIVTRNGRDARIVCTDVKMEGYPVLALFTNSNDEEEIVSFTAQGRFCLSGEHKYDLFFAGLDEEPKYRPYKDAEECFKDVRKHGGWVKAKHFDEWFHIGCIGDGFVRMVAGEGNVGEMFEQFLRDNVYADDGSPCGVKEE